MTTKLDVGYLGVIWLLTVALTWSCTSAPPPVPPPPPICTSWEYRVEYAEPVHRPPRDPAPMGSTKVSPGSLPTSITPAKDDLNAIGKEGWELAATYLETETGYTVLPDSLQPVPNVRPQRLVMMFKRLSCPK